MPVCFPTGSMRRLVGSVRRLFTYAILIVCALWLLFAYVPSLQRSLPTIAFTGGGLWMALLAALCLVIFVAIQCWIVYTTVSTVRHYQSKGLRSAFRLRLGVEFFWTALPIAMTLALAWASYPLWRDLTAR